MNLKSCIFNIFNAAEDIYDNIFVSYYENVELLEERRENDKCFRCFSYAAFIPYKLLVIVMFLFPFLLVHDYCRAYL